jgi:hypothetical protein
MMGTAQYRYCNYITEKQNEDNTSIIMIIVVVVVKKRPKMRCTLHMPINNNTTLAIYRHALG